MGGQDNGIGAKGERWRVASREVGRVRDAVKAITQTTNFPALQPQSVHANLDLTHASKKELKLINRISFLV